MPIFGWNLPPGAAGDPDAIYNQPDEDNSEDCVSHGPEGDDGDCDNLDRWKEERDYDDNQLNSSNATERRKHDID